MTIGLSCLHRLAPGWKLAALAGAGTLLLGATDVVALVAALAGVGALYGLGRVGLGTAWAQLRPAVSLVLVVAVAQGLMQGWELGLVALLRLAVLIGLATLVSLTTTTTAMTGALEAALRPLAIVGLRPRKVALALSLAVRFLPLLAARAALVRDAQRARGLERRFLALAVPLIVQSLKMAHELAEAIEARGFDPDAG